MRSDDLFAGTFALIGSFGLMLYAATIHRALTPTVGQWSSAFAVGDGSVGGASQGYEVHFGAAAEEPIVHSVMDPEGAGESRVCCAFTLSASDPRGWVSQYAGIEQYGIDSHVYGDPRGFLDGSYDTGATTPGAARANLCVRGNPPHVRHVECVIDTPYGRGPACYDD